MKNIVLFLILITIISCKNKNQSETENLPNTEMNTTQDNNPEEISTEEAEQALGEVFNDRVEMEVDENVFVVDNGTNRANEEMTAGIMKMLSPTPYEQFKIQIENETQQQEGITVVSTKEENIGGRTVIVQKSYTIDEVGDKMEMMMYGIPAENSTIMISAYYMESEKEKYRPIVEKSVASAKLKK